MKVLITNDDGVHAQGIIQLAKQIRRHHSEVFVVAPQIEQSGVSQAITFLSPLFPIHLGGLRDSQDSHIPGYSVNGTPVDCVKLAIQELCPFAPDLVLSGINGGLNVGVNVGYSGTVGAALAAATFGIPAMAISLESSENMDFEKASEIVWPLIDRFRQTDMPPRTVININVPSAALVGNADVAVVPVETNPLGYHFDQGTDPKGRKYFWSTNSPPPEPSPHLTDTQAIRAGKITVSAITYDLNAPVAVEMIRDSMSGSTRGCENE